MSPRKTNRRSTFPTLSAHGHAHAVQSITSTTAANAEDSARQIQRFIRLTNLIPELLELVDRGDIALNTAVGLSYLKPYEQRWVQEAIEYEGCTPSLSQACRLKNASKTGSLDQDDVFLMMQEEKPNQRCTIKISRDELLRYFPQHYTDEQMKQAILQSLEYLRRQRIREDRDAR